MLVMSKYRYVGMEDESDVVPRTGLRGEDSCVLPAYSTSHLPTFR